MKVDEMDEDDVLEWIKEYQAIRGMPIPFKAMLKAIQILAERELNRKVKPEQE